MEGAIVEMNQASYYDMIE
uniref:Uncharacterized protein n=1 Tax=Arundo donax TaxID=35708 RepID=A0A0A9EGU4_ARUDO